MNTVLAHGCFDLLHLGHILHLQEARKLGDRLVVSVTDDAYVGKGLGRPRFTSEQRAAALRALACVDDVIVNPAANAVGAILKVKPAFFVKGIEYSDRAEDAALAAEKTAVESVGGKIAFTKTEKFSSSVLLRSEIFGPDVDEYLVKAKADGFRDRILKAFDDADGMNIAFVGETIIDEYRYVRGLGKSPKEMMLAVVQTSREQFAGGVMAASRHAEWKNTAIVTPFETITKTRYVDNDFNRKLFDVYSCDKIEVPENRLKALRQRLDAVVKDANVLVLMDFGHGLMDAQDREAVSKAAFLAVNAQSNAGNYGYNLVTRYNSSDFICVDDPEARLATGMRGEPIDDVLHKLSALCGCPHILVTHGRFGSNWLADDQTGHAPAFAVGGIDTMGAGDAVMAVAAPLVAAGLPLRMAAFAGNIAGAIKTSIVGHRRHVQRQEIIQTVEALLA